MPTTIRQPPVPVLAGRFEVRDRLRRGSTAEIFRGTDRETGLAVAMKVLLPDVLPRSPQAVRFEHEATILETVDHPNVVRLVHPLSRERGVRYFVMEYAGRGSLRDIVNTDPAQPLDLYLTLALDVLAALKDLHRQDIIHRDVKPENLLVTDDTVGKLADFGIAQDVLNLMTVHGDILGTPTFMPPEQAKDPSNVTPSSDIFALGASLFSLITGRPGIELVATGFRQEALAACPPSVRELIAKSTEPRPTDRFSDACTMSRAVEQIMQRMVGDDHGRPRRARL